MNDPDPMARAFDDLAGSYDDAYHDEVARRLVALIAPSPDESVADVACGTGAVALSVAASRPAAGPGARSAPATPRASAEPTAPAILAVDLSAGMVAAGRARADRLGYAAAIEWRVASAVPLPVADAVLDVVMCASSLHFLGRAALADWRRVLRPGGRCGFTLPVASTFRPGGVFAGLVATDLALPETEPDAVALARAAGFTDARAREATVGSRRVILTVATSPGA
ncbi:class I SAM-dependent methyltransferase [Rugosimonospora acidiphila]|uniref:Class I SAM-dependent methyltransferase n=1 Tax=Rugosimonospora acidiphila TaxID=556531 RepID=A0ABP9SM81_9ACTN